MYGLRYVEGHGKTTGEVGDTDLCNCKFCSGRHVIFNPSNCDSIWNIS